MLTIEMALFGFRILLLVSVAGPAPTLEGASGMGSGVWRGFVCDLVDVSTGVGEDTLYSAGW